MKMWQTKRALHNELRKSQELLEAYKHSLRVSNKQRDDLKWKEIEAKTLKRILGQ